MLDEFSAHASTGFYARIIQEIAVRMGCGWAADGPRMDRGWAADGPRMGCGWASVIPESRKQNKLDSKLIQKT